MNNAGMEPRQNRVRSKILVRAGRKVAVATGTAVAMAASLMTVAPAAHANFIDQSVSSQVLFSTPKIVDEELALTTGARRERLVNASLPMVTGTTTFRTQFRPGANFTWDKVVMQILRCPTASASQRQCTVVSDKELPGPFTSVRTVSDDLTVEVDDDLYGRILMPNLKVHYSGISLNVGGQKYFAAMQQPKKTLGPTPAGVKVGDSLIGAVDEFDVSATGADATVEIYAFHWTQNLPTTNEGYQRLVRRWVCDSPNASQVQSYEWDQTGCDPLGPIAAFNDSPLFRATRAADYSDHVGRYLVVEDEISYSSLVAGGVSAVTRSTPLLIVDSAQPEANNPAQQQNQQNQGAGQQQNQQNQGAGQQQNQGAGQQQNQGAGQQAFAAAAPTGAAAVRLRTPQAPLVSSTGTGSASGTDLTVRSPAVQKRGKRKKSYRAIVDPQYRGRVAFVLTRTTPKGKMIVAKSRVKNTNKKGRAKIRWKFANKKPPGTYTLYVSFIPKARYNKTGLTVAKPVQLR